MTNTGLLREKIDASGYKLAYVASQCNLSYQGFLKKMKGQTEFKVKDRKSTRLNSSHWS